MEEEFLLYKEALTLKELGFDIECFMDFDLDDKTSLLDPSITSYTNEEDRVPAPLWQQAFKWFEKKYNIMFSVNRMGDSAFYVSFYLTTQKYSDVINQLKNAGTSCFSEIVDIYDTDDINQLVIEEFIRIVKEESDRLDKFK